MDTAAPQWPPQDIVMKPMEEIVVSCPKPSTERKMRPQKEQALNCPRCNSTNTKFCYYNNYSLSQPRYFCKTCRRYWTEGGSLRNIPVGGGSRKTKRSSAASLSIPISSKKLPDLVNPKPTQDLNLGFALHHHHDFKAISDMIHVPNFDSAAAAGGNPSLSAFISPLSSSAALYSAAGGSGFSMPEFKPSLNFSLDGIGSSYGSFQGVQETNGKLLFPFEDLKVSTNEVAVDEADRNRDHNSAGYWNGDIGGGGSW